MPRPKGVIEQTPRAQKHIVDCIPCKGEGRIGKAECADCRGLGYRNMKRHNRTKWVEKS